MNDPWGRTFGNAFAQIAKAHAMRTLEQEVRESVQQHGTDWLLDYVLVQDELGRSMPVAVYRVLAEHGFAERIGQGISTRWILTMKGRQALADRKAQRDFEQAQAMLSATERRYQRAPRPLPVLDQIRRYDAEWSD